jgi:ubiquinone/menaquinone biosynthesis C-methylase UbiE
MKETIVCPASQSGMLLFGRSLIHNPSKILGSHLAQGYVTADIGCGPGYFIPAISHFVGAKGKVYAIDLQQAMLDKAKKRIDKNSHLKNIIYLKAEKDTLGIPEKIDFALAFWMVHEVPDKDRFFKELSDVIKPGGKIVFVEPKIHVSKKEFMESCESACKSGFKVFHGVKAFFSHTAILGK